MTRPGLSLSVGLNAVIVAVTEETPRVLVVERQPGEPPALPFGPLDPAADRTLELGLRRWVQEQTGLTLGYVEQLYTFGDRDREMDAAGGSRRVLSIAYLALAREGAAGQDFSASWADVYGFLPWEDWREGPPASIEALRRDLERWADEEPECRETRHERVAVCFAPEGRRWDGERALERYELLYEAGMVEEAGFPAASDVNARRRGRAMALDHRRMVATALGRLRGKIKYRPVIFELLPDEFTLFRLQRTAETLAGVPLHKQNFRRLVDRLGLVEGTGRYDEHTGGRPAEFFRFRREVLQERHAPGVGLPVVRARTAAYR